MIEFSVLRFHIVRSLIGLFMSLLLPLKLASDLLLLIHQTIIKTKTGAFEDHPTTISDPCLSVEMIRGCLLALISTSLSTIGGVWVHSFTDRDDVAMFCSNRFPTIVIAFVGENKGCLTAISDPRWGLIDYLTKHICLRLVLLTGETVEYHAGHEFCAVEVIYCLKAICLMIDCCRIAGLVIFRATMELARFCYTANDRLRLLLPINYIQGLRCIQLVVCSLANEKFQSLLTYLKCVSPLVSVVLS